MEESEFKLKSDKLNLGCGRFKKEGFLNLDIEPEVKPDILYDLNKTPYPFPDNFFSLITAEHILEHLDNPLKTMAELFRILKLRGRLIVKVPHFSRGFAHPDHKRGFDVSFPLYFTEDFKGGYVGVPFKLETLRLNWFAQTELKKMTLSKFQYYSGLFLGKIFNFFANISPYFCSKVWCYWVGGFEEIIFIFQK